ncbi:Arginase/deacetylase [Hypoxylon cercidicola]|nr:Arginase/deacetylase [Hypoxylon cercidicola]
MATPGRERAQPWLQNATNRSDEDRELLNSLNKLSLSTSPSNSAAVPAVTNSPRLTRLATSPNSNAYSNPRTGRTPSASPSTRAPSRSPVHRASMNNLNSQSRSATPTLLRKTSMNSLHSSSGITPSRAPSRRASYNHLLSPAASKSPLNGFPQNMEEFKEKPVPTAAAVANTYMEKELELLHPNSTQSRNAETMVVLHDSCYGHRFSRPQTTKRDLGYIVERPERIQACALGVAIAYIRLGERHCDGKYPIHPELDPFSLPSVPFRIHKTNRKLPLGSATVANVHGGKWMEELKIMCNAAESKLFQSKNELSRPDMNRGPSAEPPKELHAGDLYLCEESLDAFEGALGAVCEAVDEVFSDSPCKRAFVVVRPPGHHCSASYPSGFCWLNNVHVGIMHGFMNHGLTHAAIIDFDLHHGDGSQAIALAHNSRTYARGRGLPKNAPAWQKTTIGYFSMHDINSFPCEDGDLRKVSNASVCISERQLLSVWNVHLDNWNSDVEFWKLYQSKYSILLDKARSYLRSETERYRAAGQAPKAAIFLSAGFDASEWEADSMQRHAVKVPTDFYARITRDVVKMASEEGLSVEGRVISALEGGYSDRALYSGVLSHLGGLAGGDDSVTPKEGISGGLAYEMASRIGSLSRRNTLTESEMKFPYDPSWWSASELDRLDATMDPPSQEPAKKPRNFTPGNYSSPTQASSAKAIDPTKVRRSVSGYSSQWSISRPPTPPPPDVPWNTAAHELSKLLIPRDRQVNSYNHLELKEMGAKAKRARQSEVEQSAVDDSVGPIPAAVPAPPPIRKSQRERKPVSYQENEETKTRRRTVAGHSVLATENARARGVPTQNGSRLGQQPSSAATFTTNGDPSAIPRPSTSQSIRPKSSLNTRRQAPTGLDSKKIRPPKRVMNGQAQGATLPAKPEPLVSTSRKSTQTSTDPVGDMEGITSSMKRIKINVLTKEKKEAKQVEAARKSDEKKDIQGTYTLPTATGSVQAAIPAPPLDATQINGRSLAITESQKPMPFELAPTPAVQIPIISTPVEVNSPYHRPVSSASVNTSPGRQGGHNFTPTSNIPFAPQPVQEFQSMSRDNVPILPRSPRKENGVWEIPETPQSR